MVALNYAADGKFLIAVFQDTVKCYGYEWILKSQQELMKKITKKNDKSIILIYILIVY